MQKFNSYIIRSSSDDAPAFCPKCKKDRPVSDYYTHSVRGDGAIRYRPYCKECRRVRIRQQKSRPIHCEIISSGFQSCKICKNKKPIEEFYSNGCFNDGIKKYRTSCKSCVLERLKINQKTIYKTKSEKRSSTPKNFISGILNHSAKRKQHLGFNLDLVYLLDIYEKQSGNCAISGVRMTYLAGSGRINTNISIDRIDSSKGYLRDNVQFVCDVVNRMKQDMSQGDLENWCSLILRKAND